METKEELIFKVEEGYELVESFNRHHCITPKTKLIIVGTLTPPKGAGYFYTAPLNRIYGYIDEYFGTQNGGLKAMKNKLHSDIDDLERNRIVQQIKEFLIERGVAFLDVMKYAVRKKDSCLDNDIKYFSLDLESFDNLPNAIIICNSRLAEKYFKIIQSQLSLDNDMMYLPQISWRHKGLKEKWLQAFKDAGI